MVANQYGILAPVGKISVRGEGSLRYSHATMGLRWGGTDVVAYEAEAATTTSSDIQLLHKQT